MINRTVSLSCAGFLARLRLALLAVLLAGCASLPDVNYLRDGELATHSQPKIVTANGGMSASQTRALLDGLAAKAGATSILDKHIAAEEAINGTPLVAGNKVTLLSDGPVTMRAMMDAIRNARHHVNLETYIFEADTVGQAMADLMIQKKTEGVQVNLIYDSVGAIGTPTEFFDRLRAAGINVLEYNPVNPLKAGDGWDINQRDHRKLLIVDGRMAFTGGVNISGVYGKSSLFSSKRKQAQPKDVKDAKEAAWRDTHMQIEGPVVAEFQKLFLETWQRKTGNVLPDAAFFPPLEPRGKALVRAIGSAAEKADYTIYKTYISALASADKYVHLTMAYFVPDRQIIEAITDAAKRGVEVKIIFPSFTDHSMVLYASRSYYDELLAAGVRIYERKAALLHAKTAVIDGVWSTIGSTNLDMRSFLHNDEINAVILDADFAEKMDALFRHDIEESVEIAPEQWRSRGIGSRMREWSSRLLEYWL